MCLALVAVTLFAVAMAHPWWLHQTGVCSVTLAITAALFAAAPIAFILGFAGFGSVASALMEQEQSLRLCLANANES